MSSLSPLQSGAVGGLTCKPVWQICPMFETLAQSLVARARSGDRDAFVGLVASFIPLFEARLERELSHDLHPDIPQLVQDGLLKLLQKEGLEPLGPGPKRGVPLEVKPFAWPDEAPVARFRLYAWKIIHDGVVVPHLRKRGRLPKLVPGSSFSESEGGADPFDQVAWESETPSRAARRKERQRLLPLAMAKAIQAHLTEQQAAALYLRFVERLPVAEVAERLGVTPDLVRQWCHRGLERLRGELQGQTSLFFSTR